jgi:competence protein CoiA
MQLYALDDKEEIIFASYAKKQSNYFCCECGQIVRLRSGIQRQSHFFHLSLSPQCRLSGKSMPHIQAQSHLKNILPQGECVLEHRFPRINRIADVVWLPKKLVFEIQCSPITPSEILARNRDYLTEGFEVIWVLHDSRYNQQQLSEAEWALRHHSHYFTNMNAEGEGIFYDQLDYVEHNQRKYRLSKLPIDVTQCHISGEVITPIRDKQPSAVRQRLIDRPLFFSGDSIDLCVNEEARSSDYRQRAFEIEATLLHSTKRTAIERVKCFWHGYCLRPYQLCLQILLERLSK